MTTPIFLSTFQRGQYTPDTPLDACGYCMFYQPLDALLLQVGIQGDETQMTLELPSPGESSDLRLRQVGTNLIIEEDTRQEFCAYLATKQVKYLGQAFLHALGYQIKTLSHLLSQCADDMKALEDQLDQCIDNRGTYQILDFRRKYAEYGNTVVALKDILTRIDKGYYPIQMQNSYVLQGEIMLDFQLMESRYDLVKNTLIKDLDTYTSIINNNINRSARLLSIVSLAGVGLNFLFGSFLYTNPVLGIVGGVVMGGLSAGAALRYHRGSRNHPAFVLHSKTSHPPMAAHNSDCLPTDETH